MLEYRQIKCYTSDKGGDMQSISEKILVEAKRQPEGYAFSAKSLQHLGERAAIDQALSRLCRERSLFRVTRGYYVVPSETRFGRHLPPIERVVASITEQEGEVFARGGAAAANVLGMTTQVPVRMIYVTSGTSRKLDFSGIKVELRNAPRWQLVNAGKPSGELVRALEWIGPEHADEAVRSFSEREPGIVMEAARFARLLPAWLAKTIVEAAHA